MNFLIVLGVSSLISIASISEVCPQLITSSNLTATSQINKQNYKNDDVYNEKTSPHKIIEKLSTYLPQKVIDNMDKFESEETSDGNLNYIWYRIKSDEPNVILHDIQLTATKKDNKLVFYHYKDYGYDEENLPIKNISKESAYEMVTHFAKDFIANEEELQFINKPSYFSLYDPNHVESWVAEAKTSSYIIMVNLDYGYIEYYSSNMEQTD